MRCAHEWGTRQGGDGGVFGGEANTGILELRSRMTTVNPTDALRA